MKSIGQVLDDSNGLGKGFDFLRISLALSVIVWHVYEAVNRSGYHTGFLAAASYAILVMFFGLSGFLIAGSATRLSLRNFLINRGLRIFPALAVEVILSALVLGPIFTSLSLWQYLTSPSFFLYFTNLFGAVDFYLPGVFKGGWVNGSIWTVPFELGCYIVISIFIYFGLLAKKWIPVALVSIILIIQVMVCVVGYSVHHETGHSTVGNLNSLLDLLFYEVFYATGSKLLVSFLIGLAFYIYRYSIPFSKTLALAAVACIAGSQFIPGPVNGLASIRNISMILPDLYLTLFLGLSRIPTVGLLHKGDYSYGIYLYGWPFMQATLAIFPQAAENGIFLLIVSLIPTVIFAAASWHFIEKPILQLRKKFSFVARQRLADDATDAGARTITSHVAKAS